MLKKDEIADPQSCLNKAHPDEPVFVLRAQDALAADLVRDWASLAYTASAEKREEALKLADAMEAWPKRKMPD